MTWAAGAAELSIVVGRGQGGLGGGPAALHRRRCGRSRWRSRGEEQADQGDEPHAHAFILSSGGSAGCWVVLAAFDAALARRLSEQESDHHGPHAGPGWLTKAALENPRSWGGGAGFSRLVCRTRGVTFVTPSGGKWRIFRHQCRTETPGSSRWLAPFRGDMLPTGLMVDQASRDAGDPRVGNPRGAPIRCGASAPAERALMRRDAWRRRPAARPRRAARSWRWWRQAGWLWPLGLSRHVAGLMCR